MGLETCDLKSRFSLTLIAFDDNVIYSMQEHKHGKVGKDRRLHHKNHDEEEQNTTKISICNIKSSDS